MPGAATKNGCRLSDAVLRVTSAGCAGGAGMVPARGVAAGEGADGPDRRANRSGYRARAGAYPAVRLLRESFPDCHGDAAVLPPGRVVGEPAGPRRARALLRRRSDRYLRRCRELRAGAHADGRVADGARLDYGR